jgi:hypothetical protein
MKIERIIEYNGKIYKIKNLYDGISNNWVEADFWYKDRWIEVKNLQICIDLRRFIDGKNKN